MKKNINRKVAIFLCSMLLTSACGLANDAVGTAEQIRIEVVRPNNSGIGHPLPVASSWCTGVHRWQEDMAGWAPKNQMKLIAQGHHLLPWFNHPPIPQRDSSRLLSHTEEGFNEYYEAAIKRAAELKLPIVFVGTQWEYLLSEGDYLALPPEQNPNVINPDGNIEKRVSPFGPVAPWREVGRLWTDNANLKKLQEWYPDPPKVIFLSNNEHGKLQWHQVETSKRYMDKYGDQERSDDFKRQVVGDGWIERYRALQQGMREGLANKTWRENAMFVGYGGDAGKFFIGRWPGWRSYSLITADRLDPGSLMWDGVSVSYYIHTMDRRITDYTVWSPQQEYQNMVFQNRLSQEANPDFWFEISSWDGSTFNKERDKRKQFEELGQTYSPARYGGMVQFGMWLIRPRAVREYRNHVRESWTEQEPYFMAIVNAVDRIYDNPTLQQWWRKGRLVPNRARKHPYQSNFPKQFADEDRWFLLDADVNLQTYPWKLSDEIKVFSLALTQGEKPERKWLVYAHSPLAERKNVKLTIPEYDDIVVDVAVGGSFYEVMEKDKSVRAIQP